jgi:hypothetical protein
MPYNESHSELREHPKTKRLKRALNISLPTAIGHLQCLWWWVMDYAPNGDLSRYDAADIAEGAEWEGDPETFVSALLECRIGPEGVGFLERTPDGRLLIHDWYQYGGKLVTKRFVDAYRKRTGSPPTHDEMRSAGLPLPPQTDVSESSVGAPSEVARISDELPCDRAGRAAERSVAERRAAEHSVSKEQQQQSVEESVRGDPAPLVHVDLPAAAAASDKSQGDAENALLPRPDENPMAYVNRVLAGSPDFWKTELDRRWRKAERDGGIRHEWPWKRRLVRDWVTGADEPPEPPKKVFAAPPLVRLAEAKNGRQNGHHNGSAPPAPVSEDASPSSIREALRDALKPPGASPEAIDAYLAALAADSPERAKLVEVVEMAMPPGLLADRSSPAYCATLDNQLRKLVTMKVCDRTLVLPENYSAPNIAETKPVLEEGA